MEVKTTIEILIKDIQEIGNRITRGEISDPVPQIEVDLMLSKLRDLYESVYRLKILQGRGMDKPEKADEAVPERKKTEPAAVPDTTLPEETASTEEEDKPSFELEPEPELPAGKEDKAKTTAPSGTEKKTAPTSDTRAKTPEIVADRYKDKHTFRNETLAKNVRGGDISSKLQSKPIRDIISAIGVNDRFLFIKELFNGNTQKFDETIRALNNSPNFNEAYNYLSENFSWDMDDPSVQKLLELTRRKHITNTDE